MFKKLIHGGNSFIVDMQEQSTGFHCLLQEEGKSDLSVPVEEFRITGPDSFSIRTHDYEEHGRFQIEGDTVYLHLRGHTYVLREVLTGASATEAESAHRSPMPGKVQRVLVAAGDTVTEGQTLIVVEAMKMENAIKATHGGTVKSVHCGEGEIVDPETILVEIEP